MELPPNFILGLNKGDHHSSACLLTPGTPFPDIEIFLKERINRVKNAGGWPLEILSDLHQRTDFTNYLQAENCFGWDTLTQEEKFDFHFPFFDLIKKKDLTRFSPHFNKDIRFFTHHYCHALSALITSPFSESLIIVMDGVGNHINAFPENHPEVRDFPFKVKGQEKSREPLVAEACTVYLQKGLDLTCVYKEWQKFRPTHRVKDCQGHDPEDFGEGLGAFYETVAKFIFNSYFSAGKVMGLSPHGVSRKISGRLDFLHQLNWEELGFRGKGKADWDHSGRFQVYADVAATAQEHFEDSFFELILNLKNQYPQVENLILAGGCALNCLFNQKMIEKGPFKNLHVPPYPGDEGISLGAAAARYYQIFPQNWQPWPHERQVSSFGPKSSVPENHDIEKLFSEDHLIYSPRVAVLAAQRLQQGDILAWFQGRSECGPRALGNRSLLASPRRPHLKDFLNERIKKREFYRPFGLSCPWEKAAEYFEVPWGFEAPFMSFAPLVRPFYRDILQEVSSLDGRSRIQTLRREQNPLFHELLMEFGELTGLFCLLNTSLNGEEAPIVETPQDLKAFWEETPVDGLVIGNYLISRKA